MRSAPRMPAGRSLCHTPEESNRDGSRAHTAHGEPALQKIRAGSAFGGTPRRHRRQRPTVGSPRASYMPNAGRPACAEGAHSCARAAAGRAPTPLKHSPKPKSFAALLSVFADGCLIGLYRPDPAPRLWACLPFPRRSLGLSRAPVCSFPPASQHGRGSEAHAQLGRRVHQ